jgi:hypothetical protein
MASSEISITDIDGHVKTATCDWRTTLASAAFQSPSRLRLARECGLRLTGYGIEPLQYVTGLYADVPTLRVAEELGMVLSGKTLRGAASSDREDVILYLLQRHVCPADHYVAEHAAQRCYVDVLQSLRQNSFEFSVTTCFKAAAAGQLVALQYIWSTLKCTCSSSKCYNV